LSKLLLSGPFLADFRSSSFPRQDRRKTLEAISHPPPPFFAIKRLFPGTHFILLRVKRDVLLFPWVSSFFPPPPSSPAPFSVEQLSFLHYLLELPLFPPFSFFPENHSTPTLFLSPRLFMPRCRGPPLPFFFFLCSLVMVCNFLFVPSPLRRDI